MAPPRPRLRLTGDSCAPEWMVVPKALGAALDVTRVWSRVPEGGSLVIGGLEYSVTPVVATSTQPGDRWGHLRITCWGAICRPEEPVLRLAIAAILYGWHHASALHNWNIAPPFGIEPDSRLGDVELTGGVTYLPPFFTDMEVEVAHEALLGIGTPGALRQWLILTAIPVLDSHGTLLPK